MKKHIDTLSSFIVGLIFGIGLIFAGMTDPSKVIGFLDIAGNWDPSLAFVMGVLPLVLAGGAGSATPCSTFRAPALPCGTGCCSLAAAAPAAGCSGPSSFLTTTPSSCCCIC